MRTRFHSGVMAIALVVSACGMAVAQEERSIWGGVFNEEQATRGERAFLAACARCHLEDLTGKNGPALRGSDFFEKWRETNLEILFSTVKTMPPTSQRNPVPRLPENTSLDILTHILKVNGAPRGTQELKFEHLGRIQFEKQTGPEPVPNLTLVRVTGCVSQPTPTTWAVVEASDPVRAMNPELLSVAELDAAKVAAPGKNSFRLNQIDYIDKPMTDFKGRAVAIKGIFVRADNGTRINLMTMEIIAATCPK
jgi:hypothetical protein